VKRKFRITRAIDFKRVRRDGKSYAHPLTVVIVTAGTTENSRVGFITGKSIGNAVQRNRVKRQLRSVVSGKISHFIQNADILVIAREPIRKANFENISSVLTQLLSRAGLLDRNDSDTRRPGS
jgi:ribonuclease P protein component